MIRVVSRVFIAALVIVAIGGCGSPSTVGDALLVGNNDEPESLDPHLGESIYSSRIIAMLFEGLVNLDPETLEPVPGVAERWETSDDGLTWTFHLREDARWSDGEAVSSADFLYAWKRMLSPEFAASYSYMLHCVENAKAFNDGELDDFSEVGFSAPDERTVVVRLAYPAPYFLTLHAHQSWYPVPQAAIEKFGDTTQRDTKWIRPGNLVGNGPYALAEWKPSNYIELGRNEHYWDNGATELERVRFFPVSSENTEERMFRAGELHMTDNMPLAKVDTWREENPDSLRIDPYASISFGFFNVTKPPFDDARVRRAFSMTIDREAIVDSVRGGVDVPAYHFTPVDIGGYTSPAKIDEDVAAAKALLADAGYPGGEGFPRVELLYSTSDLGKYLTEVIQQMWQEKLGVKVEINNQEWKVFLSTTAEKNFDIAVMGWSGDFLDPLSFLEILTSENGNNRTGYVSAEYDALVERASRQNDRAERYRLFGEAETLLLQDSPVIPMYYKALSFLAWPEVKNFPPNLMGYRRYDRMFLAVE